MESKKNIGLYILLSVILVAAIVSSAVSAVAVRQVMQANKTLKKMNEEKVEKTQEDGVMIAEQYEIKSTVAISDAYKNQDDSQLSEEDKETLKMASDILDEIITDDMKTDYDKELAVYEWMVKNISSGSNSLLVTSNSPEAVGTPHGVLKGKSAVCVGYATTFRLFMQMLDIECKVVHNTDKYHSWDEVKLDDDWYYVDVYSDAGGTTYNNFNMTDAMCERGHDWDHSFWPSAVGTKYNYAILNAKKCDDLYEIPAKIRKSMEKGGKTLFFNIGTDEDGSKQTVLSAMYQTAMGYVGQWNADVTFSMMEGTDHEYILSISFYNYNQSGSTGQISGEQQQKLDEAMQKAFEGYTGEGMMSDENTGMEESTEDLMDSTMSQSMKDGEKAESAEESTEYEKAK
ncbi:MAG: transglutaminase domain-containing protein [Lachnospiraceae bacterium]